MKMLYRFCLGLALLLVVFGPFLAVAVFWIILILFPFIGAVQVVCITANRAISYYNKRVTRP